jgi:thiamine-phosphate pyrophosphorylase
VTDRKALAGDNSVGALLEKIRVVVAAGADWVQIREKDLAVRELLALVRGAVAAGHDLGLRGLGLRADGPRVTINDRVDVALAAGAAGVHLGHASVPAREAVRWCRQGNAPADFLIGVSCHSLEGAKEAESAGASYTYFGPIYETPSKIPFGVPHGIAELAAVCEAVRIPVIAIGGVNESNAAECLNAGAAGIAAIRMIQDAPDRITLQDTLEKIHHPR